jgi:hypothetical protein
VRALKPSGIKAGVDATIEALKALNVQDAGRHQV